MERNLKVFLAVARSGNLTSAAEMVGLTQPALTKTIRRLEGDFGAKLFERTARGMVLTSVGETLFNYAQTIELKYQQAHEEIEAVRSGMVKEFKISAGPAYHATIAPDLTKQLSIEFPETNFILSVDVAVTSTTKLLDGEIDLMLGAFYKSPPDGLETLEIFKAEITPYCGVENSLAAAGILAPDMLRNRQWIVYKRDELAIQKLEEYYAEHLLPPPRIVMRVDPLSSAFRIVATSDMLVLAPAYLEIIAGASNLCRLKMEIPIWKFPSGAWYRQASRHYPIMRRALELLPNLID